MNKIYDAIGKLGHAAGVLQTPAMVDRAVVSRDDYCVEVLREVGLRLTAMQDIEAELIFRLRELQSKSHQISEEDWPDKVRLGPGPVVPAGPERTYTLYTQEDEVVQISAASVSQAIKKAGVSRVLLVVRGPACRRV